MRPCALKLKDISKHHRIQSKWDSSHCQCHLVLHSSPVFVATTGNSAPEIKAAGGVEIDTHITLLVRGKRLYFQTTHLCNTENAHEKPTVHEKNVQLRPTAYNLKYSDTFSICTLHCVVDLVLNG